MWPFTRKPQPNARQITPGPINEDWRVGDLAECMTGGWPDNLGPEKGDVCRVSGVGPGIASHGYKRGKPLWFLSLKGFPGADFDAAEFRKVPSLESEADAAFKAELKSRLSKRHRAGEPA